MMFACRPSTLTLACGMCLSGNREIHLMNIENFGNERTWEELKKIMIVELTNCVSSV